MRMGLSTSGWGCASRAAIGVKVRCGGYGVVATGADWAAIGVKVG